jgi:hypothetical protein
MAQFHLPSSLDLTDGNLADSFKKWKRQLEVYMEASGNNNKPKQRQTAIILHCAGRKSLRFMIILNLKEKMTKMILLKCSKN